jgi:hypothetical protein
MKSNPKINIFGILLLFTLILTDCSPSVVLSSTPLMEDSVLPTAASTLPELINNLSDDDMAVRLVSIGALEKYGNDAVPAIPKLIMNLQAEDFDVRKAAADILGIMGSKAQEAVPELMEMLQRDTYYHARLAAAKALGEIRDPRAIPVLVAVIFEDGDSMYNAPIICAESISKITGERFTNEGSKSYTINENGIPIIVLDARNWWVKEGQYKNWSAK